MRSIQKRGENEFSLFDQAINNFFRPLFFSDELETMKTDIKEYKTKYEMEIEMPGFDKNDIAVNLEDGYLNISAKKSTKENEENDGGAYLKKERSVSCSRSYYVGDLKEEDVKAKYNDGVLFLTLPKKVQEKVDRKQISIE